MAAAPASAMCILLIFLLPILLFAFKGEDSEDYEYKLNQDYIIGDEDVYDSSNSRAGVLHRGSSSYDLLFLYSHFLLSKK